MCQGATLEIKLCWRRGGACVCTAAEDGAREPEDHCGSLEPERGAASHLLSESVLVPGRPRAASSPRLRRRHQRTDRSIGDASGEIIMVERSVGAEGNLLGADLAVEAETVGGEVDARHVDLRRAGHDRCSVSGTI